MYKYIREGNTIEQREKTDNSHKKYFELSPKGFTIKVLIIDHGRLVFLPLLPKQ